MILYKILCLGVILSLVSRGYSAVEQEEEAEEEEEGEEILYFYFGSDDAKPIVEYPVVPKGQEDRPDFIYSPTTGIRLVEFYAHWCPHCQVSFWGGFGLLLNERILSSTLTDFSTFITRPSSILVFSIFATITLNLHGN